MKRLLRLSAVLITCLASVTACAQESPVDSSPDLLWAESFRWESTPGVDLDSPAAQVVRAAVESDEISLALGLRYTYPGYLEASDGAGTLPSKGPDGGIGTLRMRLAELEESPTRFDALVCLDTTQISTLADDRYRLPTGDPFYVLHAYRVSARLSDPATEPPTSSSSEDLLVPSETYALAGPPGRDARPSGDVFGNWKITEFAMSVAPEDRDPCLAWAEQRWGGPNPPAPTRTDAEPPAIEPFHPGW